MTMYSDYYVYGAELLGLAGAANGVMLTNIENDADFEAQSYVVSAVSRTARVMVVDATAMRLQSDNFEPVAGSFGTGAHPFHLPVSKRFARGSVLQTVVFDESLAANQFRFSYHGAKLLDRPPMPIPQFRARETFTAVGAMVPVALDPAGLGAIPVGGVFPWSFRVDGGAWMQWSALSIIHNGAAPPAGGDSVALLQIQDSTSDRPRYSNIPLPIEAFGATLAGAALASGDFPYRLRAPKLWAPGTVVTFTVQNLLAAAALNIRIVVKGAKLYT
jgi:hypothetical protein